MNINKGDYLVCKKNYIQEDKIYLQEGKAYEIQASGPNNILISECCLWFSFSKIETSVYYSGYYIWDYFYNKADWREQQINNILND